MKTLLLAAIFVTSNIVLGQSPFGKEPLAHTYSIVAVDETTGDLGVAVQSHWFSVGSLVTWGEAGVGVIATQSFVNPAYGPKGLSLLKMGFSAKEVLDILIQQDEGREFRQVAILDAQGTPAAYTGHLCIENAGHIEGEGFSVQANLMDNDQVWPTMAQTFRDSSHLPLAERLVASLAAAEEAGGDIRGRQSAAVLVVRGTSSGKPWEDKIVDLRVDDHQEPILELKRLLQVHRAYEHMNKGDLAIENGDLDGALMEYGSAQEMFPDNLEMQYWHAVALSNMGRLEEALPMFKRIFDENPNWKRLTPRLTKNSLLKVKRDELRRILEL